MVKYLPTLALFLLSFGLVAQVQLSNAYFPAVGDTLHIVDADSAYAASLDLRTAGGANLEWNFGTPVPNFTTSIPVLAVTAGDLFPEADLKIQTNVFTESYYRVNATSFDLVGISSRLAILPDFAVSTAVLPARPTRRAPLNFGDNFSTVTENSAVFSPDSLPAEALVLVGDLLDNVDSVRITTISTRADVADAYGSLTLGSDIFDVLREKRVESIFIRLEVKTNPLPFIDITNLVIATSPALAPFVGQQPSTTTYFFWSNEHKEPIAEVVTNTVSGEVEDMMYRRPDTRTSTSGPGLLRATVNVFPNPADDWATFQVEGLPQGQYSLTLLNMLGNMVAQRSFSPVGNQTRLRLDVSQLPSGIYLYSVRNERGRIITTRRLRVY